jgi:hypothetical protein
MPTSARVAGIPQEKGPLNIIEINLLTPVLMKSWSNNIQAAYVTANFTRFITRERPPLFSATNRRGWCWTKGAKSHLFCHKVYRQSFRTSGEFTR